MRAALLSAIAASICFGHAPAAPPAVHVSDTRIAADEGQVEDALRRLGPDFTRFETRHFVILSDCTPRWTRSRGVLLERTRDQFLRMARALDIPVTAHEHKLMCVLFDDPRRYAAFARAQDGLTAGWVAGYYATGTNRIVFYNDENAPALLDALEQLDDFEAEAESRRQRARHAGPGDLASRLLASADEMDGKIRAERSRLKRHAQDVAQAKTIHEAVHLLAFNTGFQLVDRDYPFWLSEGLATSFETHDPSAAFGPAHPSRARDERVRTMLSGGTPIPLARLVSRTSAPSDDAATADSMYLLSYALFAYLYRHERRSLAAYIGAFADAPPGPLSERAQFERFTTHFGDPARLERRVVAFMQSAR